MRASKAKVFPSIVLTTTIPSASLGEESTSLDIFERHFSSPVSFENPTISPSLVPTKTNVSPTPVPPVIGSCVLLRHIYLPVFLARAATIPLGSAMNTFSSKILGVIFVYWSFAPFPIFSDHTLFRIAVSKNEPN